MPGLWIGEDIEAAELRRQAEQTALRALVLLGRGAEKNGISSFTLCDICRVVEQHLSQSYGTTDMSRLLRRMRLSWQETRLVHAKRKPTVRTALSMVELVRAV